MSAAVLVDQLDWLRDPVEVLTAPLQTLMVTVTAPTPGDATLDAVPVNDEHEAVALCVGVAVGGVVVGGTVVGGVDAEREAVGDAAVGLADRDGCPVTLPLGVTQAPAPRCLPRRRSAVAETEADPEAHGWAVAVISWAEAGKANLMPMIRVDPAMEPTIATVVLRRTMISEGDEMGSAGIHLNFSGQVDAPGP